MADANKRDERGRTPLHLAAAGGTPANIAALLDAGADIEARVGKDGNTPLHRAAAHGTPDIIRTLIDVKAEVNARNKHGDTTLDWTFEDWMYRDISKDISKILREAGAKHGDDL